MRRFLQLTAFTLLFCLITSFAISQTNEAKVISQFAKVYETTDINSNVLRTLTKGVEVIIIEERGDWCHISVNNRLGWVQKSDLDVADKQIESGRVTYYQDTEPVQTPEVIKPEKAKEKPLGNFLGITSGFNQILTPEKLNETPTGSNFNQASLLGDLDGAGFKRSPNFGISFLSQLSYTTDLAFYLSYNRKKSNIPLVQEIGGPKVGTISPSLSVIQFGFGVKYSIFNNYPEYGHYSNTFNVYIEPDINFSYIMVSHEAKDDFRGDFKYEKDHLRLGAGAAIGCMLEFFDVVGIDISARASVLNLLLRQKNDVNTFESEAIITNPCDHDELFISSYDIRATLYFKIGK